MLNPILKWALQILQQPEEISISEPVSEVLKLVDIKSNQIQVNSQPLESIFSTIGEHTSIIEKRISWQALDAQQIVYPREHTDKVALDVPEPSDGWDRFYENDNLALVLIEKYGTFLSISPQIPDISFYDVVKTLASIHDCRKRCLTHEPFLLVSGDFSGIQETIYTIASSGALKTLRARSFMLELLTEHIIHEIQQATASGRHSLIFSGGGGFNLLVPNTDDNRTAIDTFASVINEWMFDQFGFQLFLALDCVPLSIDNLKNVQFKETWELIADKLSKQKQRKFRQINNFEDLFRPKMPQHLANQDACQITHRDDLPEEEMDYLQGVGRVTKLAGRLWRLGDLLTDFTGIVRLPSPRDDFITGTLVFPTHESQPNNYGYAEYKAINQLSQVSNYDARWLVNSWKLDDYDEKTLPFLYGNYVRSVADLPDEAQVYEKEDYRKDRDGQEMSKPTGVTASFSGLAKAAQGSELIGCLRMDVDNSGEFFPKIESNVGLGIAKSSNLSRSMNLFFKGYLNQICGMELGDLAREDYPTDITGKKVSQKNGRDVSIVYAGGDDLFIVGAWDDIAELAFDINACFNAFSCSNPDVHLSGGVTLHKPKFPLYQMARLAKQAEEIAKANEWEIDTTKNSLALFYSADLKARNASLDKRIESENYEYLTGEPEFNRIAVASQWNEYNHVIQLTKQLHEVYAELPHGFYRKLLETLKIWQEEGLLYMPMMCHTLRQLDQIQTQAPTLASLKPLLFQQDQVRRLHIPLQWVEYLNRQKGGD